MKSLSRIELKGINGGMMPTAICTWTPDYTNNLCTGWKGVQISYDPDNQEEANLAQQTADGLCAAATCCSNVDCIGAAA